MDNQIFFDTSSVIFIVSKAGLIENLNKAALNFIELDLKECKGKRFTSFIETNKNQVLKIFELINENIFPKSIEAKFKLNNNKSFYTTISINKYFNDEINEEQFIVTLFDLTHHKMKAELEKKASLDLKTLLILLLL